MKTFRIVGGDIQLNTGNNIRNTEEDAFLRVQASEFNTFILLTVT
jgi:hypothetical protein